MILFHDYRAATHGGAGEALDRAALYVLTPSAVEAVMGFTQRPEPLRASLPFLTFPTDSVWIEWTDAGMRVALLLHATTAAPRPAGVGVQISRDVDGRLREVRVGFDFAKEERPLWLEMDRRFAAANPVTLAAVAEQFEMSFGRFAAAAFALIRTPRVVELRPTDLAKFNKSRVKRGKPTLREWSDVYLNLDHATASGTPAGTAEPGPAGGRKRRHEVFPFLRIRLGRVEAVRAHERGDASLGRAPRRRFIVTSKP